MNPFAKQQKEYLKVKVQTASKEQLVLMLMDGVIRFSEQGRQAIESKEIEKKQFSLVRSQDIIMELIGGLNHELGGEIAANLARLYTYSIRRLIDANMKNDTTGIDEVQNIFRNLREAWAGAMDKVHKDQAEETGPAPELQLSEAARPQPATAAAPASGLSGLKSLSGLKLAPAPAAATATAGIGSLGATVGGSLGGGLRSLGSLATKKPEGERPRLSVQG